jgi:hypothetical protein
VDGTVVATVETYVAAQEAAEAEWMTAEEEHITGQQCITTRDSERSGYGWSKKSTGWLCNDAKDPKFPNLG